MTYFPFPNIVRGRRGTGEVGTTVFSVPPGSLDFWERHLADNTVEGISRHERFGEHRLSFTGSADGDGFALVEVADDARRPWTDAGIPPEHAIRGFHSASMVLADSAATRELLEFMGFSSTAEEGGIRRLVRVGGNGADIVDLETRPDMRPAREGGGSVHHIAFAAADAAAQTAVREALVEQQVSVTPVIDRDYFLSIYFRTPGGVLFEIATNEPGFACDEDPAHLGEALKLPRQHAHLRHHLEGHLPPIGE